MAELSSWPWEMYLVGRQKEEEIAPSADRPFSVTAIHNADLPQQLGACAGG